MTSFSCESGSVVYLPKIGRNFFVVLGLHTHSTTPPGDDDIGNDPPVTTITTATATTLTSPFSRLYAACLHSTPTMDARLLRRVACPAAGLPTSASASSSFLLTRLIPTSLSASAPSAASSAAVLPASRRYQSTRNRTKRALNIAPHASFAVPGSANTFRPNKHATGAASSEGATAAILGTVWSPSKSAGAAATILYNPPASAPSVYQTPFKFLPKSDPRRVLSISNMFKAIDAAPAASAGATAPLVNRHFKPTEKYHLSEEDVAEMRRLRAEDPKEWSVLALAKKYQCSAVFVMLATKGKAGEAHTAASKARLDAVKERWGPIRTKARVERTKRREMLYSGQL